MLTAYIDHHGRLEKLADPTAPGALRRAVWIDVVEPTDEEREIMSRLLPWQLPAEDDLEEIEASSRSFADEHGLHISSWFLRRLEGRDETVNAAFRLTPTQLFTMHDPEVPVLRLMRMRANRGALPVAPRALLRALYETKLDELADTLEEIHESLDEYGQDALQRRSRDFADAAAQLTEIEHLNSKVRLCLVDAQRDLTFLLRHGGLDKAERRQWQTLLRDIDSLLPHCEFLFEKVTFLLHALQGFVNIEQNQIIKIFSVVAVIFLPPTLIASSYGMNFHIMPELDWPFGYPMAIVMMILSGIAPYLLFKRKGWL
ncbi:MAG: magnesium/cobalt transporter CorA [Pseudomonadales bacterium]